MRYSFYRELFEFILTLLPDVPHTVRKRLVCLVLGILLAKSVVLSRVVAALSTFWGSSIAVESHECRLRRIENDARLGVKYTHPPKPGAEPSW